jgi:hypothetical protein
MHGTMSLKIFTALSWIHGASFQQFTTANFNSMSHSTGAASFFPLTCSIGWMSLHIYNSSLEQVSVTPLCIIHTDLRLHTTLSVNVYLKQHTRIANRISRTIVIHQLNFFSKKKKSEIWVKSEITIPYDLTPYSLVDRYKHFRGTWCHLLKLLTWRWRQQDSMKRWYLSTKYRVSHCTGHSHWYKNMQWHIQINSC